MAVVVTLAHPEIAKRLDSLGSGARGDFAVRYGTIAFDASYPNTGGTVGEPVVAGDFNLDSIDLLLVGPAYGHAFEYDATAGTIKVYWGNTDAGADGPLEQRANTADLSAMTAVPFIVFGRVSLV